jgi:hypothetical protein
MIIVKIQGGLGNQMFQWACARKLAIQYKTRLMLDVSSYTTDRLRTFQLPLFNNVKRLIENEEVVILNGIQHSSEMRYIIDTFRIIEFSPPPIYLNGYWQSEVFFNDIERIIRHDFNLEDIGTDLEVFPNLDKSVSLHVRRGDYLQSNDYHPIQSINYYRKAIDIIGEYDNIYVFSDDLDWCESNLDFDRMLFVDLNEIETLNLMSQMKHNIIANSSFSWWGAWLNNNSEKKVVAPTRWFGEVANLNYDMIVPKSWIKI